MGGTTFFEADIDGGTYYENMHSEEPKKHRVEVAELLGEWVQVSMGDNFVRFERAAAIEFLDAVHSALFRLGWTK